MLSIGKLAGGAEGYYLRAVASGVEDYYLGSGEAPGRWVGAGSVRLGLAGVVSPEQLRAVLDGRDPATGKSLLWVRRPDRLPGLDLTFSAPKSVSLLFALGDEQLSAVVRRAHDAAVTQALGYLEREAGEVRRGKDGRDRLPGGGFVAAAFRHRTSRAGDPQLHTHVLVANMTRGSDGRWSALDGRQLYLQAKTAGTLYQAALRDQLAPLGLAWMLHPNGTAEVEGIPRAVLRGFSRRREQIEAELAAHGAAGPRAAQLATLATRPTKQPGVDPVTLAGRWQARAHELEFEPADLHRVLGRTTAVPPSAEVLAATTDRLLGPDGLTARSPVFDRRAAIRAWCSQLPAGASVAEVEALADRLLADHRVVPIDADAGSTTPGAERSFARHTTEEMLTVERFVLDTALAGRGAGAGVADLATVQVALAERPDLHPEQVAMVRALTGRGDLVQVVVGKAGSGKSHALAAAAQAWEASGLPVLGAAVAARAASELSTATGMPAMTVARLLAHAEHPGAHGLPRGTAAAGGADRGRGRHARHPPTGPTPAPGPQRWGLPGAGRGPPPAPRTRRGRRVRRPDPPPRPDRAAHQPPAGTDRGSGPRSTSCAPATCPPRWPPTTSTAGCTSTTPPATSAAPWSPPGGTAPRAGWQRLWQPAWQPIWQPIWQPRPPRVGTARCSCWPPAAPTSTTSTAAPAPCWPPTAT